MPLCAVREPAGFQGRRTSRLLSNQRKEKEKKKKEGGEWIGRKRENIHIGRKRDANVFAGEVNGRKCAEGQSPSATGDYIYARDAGIQGGGELPG